MDLNEFFHLLKHEGLHVGLLNACLTMMFLVLGLVLLLLLPRLKDLHERVVEYVFGVLAKLADKPTVATNGPEQDQVCAPLKLSTKSPSIYNAQHEYGQTFTIRRPWPYYPNKLVLSPGRKGEYSVDTRELQYSGESSFDASDDEYVLTGSNGDKVDYESCSCASCERKRDSLSTYASTSEHSYSDDDEPEYHSPHRKQQRLQHPEDMYVASVPSKKTRQRRAYDLSYRQKNPAKKPRGWKNIKEKVSAILHHGSSSKNKRERGIKIATTFPFLKRATSERHALVKLRNTGSGSKELKEPICVLLGRLLKRSKRSKVSDSKKMKPLQNSRYGKIDTPAKLNWMNLLKRYKKKNKKLRIGFRKRC